jgi:hypothetical protein
MQKGELVKHVRDICARSGLQVTHDAEDRVRWIAAATDELFRQLEDAFIAALGQPERTQALAPYRIHMWAQRSYAIVLGADRVGTKHETIVVQVHRT